MKWHASSRSVRYLMALQALLAIIAYSRAPAIAAPPPAPDPSALPHPCPLPGAPPDPNAPRGCAPVTPQVPTGSGGGAAAGGSGSGAGAGGGGGSSGGQSGGSSESQPSQTTDGMPAGVYVVHQTETQGGAVISGGVCRLGDPFVVNFVTPKVTFGAMFTPRSSPVAGAVSYAYSIPRAGESHQAQGTYSGRLDTLAGSVHITMSVRDHVVFHGFDGTMPIIFRFDLVSTPGAACGPHR